jgi:dsRNA-specific ribonuclease
MTVRRFKFDFDGEVFYCAGFESEAARERVLAHQVAAPAPVLPEVLHDPPSRGRGRPASAAAIIADAVEALGAALNPRATLSDRRRLVLQHIAQTVTDPSLIPATRTVETFLASQIRKKERRKSRSKSDVDSVRVMEGSDEN